MKQRVYQKSILYCLSIFIPAPTTKAVGSIDITKLEPTALVVGLLTKTAA